MQFLVLAFDGKDEGAPARRRNARPAHIEGIKRLQVDGKFRAGGAILDDAGKMIGSAIFLEFDSREALDDYIRNDPYTSGGVWEDVQIMQMKLV